MTGRKGMCCAMLCLLVVSLAVVLPAGPVVAAPPPGDHPAGGRQLHLLFPGGAPPAEFVPGLITLTSDGTVITATGSDEGGPIFDVKNSPTHGVWSRTGPRSVRGTAFFLNYDKGTGSVVAISRVTIDATFDKNFRNLEGTCNQVRFLCVDGPFNCPDPLADPEPPSVVILTDAPFRATRIR